MKRVGVGSALAVAACALVLSGCLHSERPISTGQAWTRFVGTWVNTDYPGMQPYVQQMVLRPDLVGEDWDRPTDTRPDGVWQVRPKKAWRDPTGNTYLQYYFRYTERYAASGVALMLVDRAGKVLELNSLHGSETGPYPDQIDPGTVSAVSFYFVYYRK